MVNRGGPDKPLKNEEVATKFDDNAKRVLPLATVELLRAEIENLDAKQSVAAIAGLLRPPTIEQ